MAANPRTFPADASFDEMEEFLEHFWLYLLACPLTVLLATVIEKLLTGLDGCRDGRRKLARALAALKAKEIFTDDELNLILDQVKDVLAADKSNAGVELYKDVFEGKAPRETRKYILGPQLSTMALWPGKLAGSTRAEVLALGVVTETATTKATLLLNEIGQAATTLDQYDLVTRAAFVENVNAQVKLVFGQLSEIEHTPPPAANGPIPPGFVDRFILRESTPRPPTIKELEKAIDGTEAKLAKQKVQLKELKDKQAKDLAAEQAAEVAEKLKQVAAAQKVIDDAAAELAKLQAEIAKITPPSE